MEEIQFSTCPELIVSLLLTEELGDTEVLVASGCEQFSTIKGYGHTLKYGGPCESTNSKTHLDALGRLRSQVVAMDALHFGKHNSHKQYSEACIKRELNKCFVAFDPRYADESDRPIASGSWGCGAFNGDPELKFLIQWMAASQAGGRSLVLCIPDEQEFKRSQAGLQAFHMFLQRSKIKTVGHLYRLIVACGFDILKSANAEYGNYGSSGFSLYTLIERKAEAQ